LRNGQDVRRNTEHRDRLSTSGPAACGHALPAESPAASLAGFLRDIYIPAVISMNRKQPKTAAAAFLVCMLGMPALPAQEKKAVIRLTPKPYQAFKCETVQEMEMDATMEGVPQTSGPVSMKMVNRTVFGFSEKTGAPKDQGMIEAEVTYDKISSDKILNGKPMPPDNLGVQLVGKTITFTYDKEGRVVDVRVPPDIDLSAETLKQMMNSLQGNLPSAEMAAGDTTSTPFSMPLPIPTPGLNALNATGQARYKLVALEKEGTDLIARLEQVVEAGLVTTLDLPLAKGTAKVSVDFKVNGTGGLQLNLTRGIMKMNEQELTIDGDMKMTSDSTETPSGTLKLHGRSKMTSTATY
jgi:hypothetical protein